MNDKKWLNEPNELNGEHKGLTTLIKRVPRSGHLCGYVGLPKGHPLHGVAYGDSVKVDPSVFEKEIDVNRISAIKLICGTANEEDGTCDLDLAINVHGGLTYSEDHAPEEDPDGLWWFGFDCAHSGDYQPGSSWASEGDIYRDIEYVKRECESLAEQLVNWPSGL